MPPTNITEVERVLAQHAEQDAVFTRAWADKSDGAKALSVAAFRLAANNLATHLRASLALIDRALKALPVGYLPNHTAETLPERIADMAKRCAEVDRLEAQLAEANAQLALCAENTAAADLAQEVEYLKAELVEAREELARLGPVEYEQASPNIDMWWPERVTDLECNTNRRRAIRRVLPGETGGGE